MKVFCNLKWTRLAWLVLASGVLTASAAAPVAVSLGANTQALQTPARVAADMLGNCYVSDPAAGQVVVFDAFGRIAAVRQGFAGPLAIAVDGSGHIFLGEEQTRSVSVFDAQWNFLYKLGSGDGEFTLPNYLAFDTNGNVFVSDGFANAVKVYAGATLVYQFGSAGTGNGQFDFPAGIAVSAGGEVFVVDQNNERAQVFSLDGVFKRSYKFTKGMLNTPTGRKQGVLLDNAGRLYVADTFQGIVKVYDAAAGTYLSTIGSFGSAPGQLRSPAGLALDGFNRLKTASIKNSRVEIFGLDSFIHLSIEPPTQLVSADTPVTLSVVVGGAGPFTYQWRKGTNNLTDGGGVSGATNATLTLTGLSAADSGLYSVVVDGPTNTFTSPDAALNVLQSPSVLTPPADQIVAQGSNVVFEVLAAGDSLAYQWSFNGNEVAGATTSILQLTNVQPSDSGSYSVVISNAIGNASSVAALNVLVPPSIATQPVSQTIIQWDTVTFEVVAEGDALAYQWFFNSDAIPDATAAALVRTSVQLAEQGNYSVVVSNLVGVVASDPAQLTVVIPPPPTNPPQIDLLALLSDNTVQLSAICDAGHAFDITASTNLVDWTTLARMVSVTGTIDYTDADAPSITQRFYRVVWVP